MRTSHAKTAAAAAIIAVFALAAAGVLRTYTEKKSVPVVFSNREMLAALWNSYKKEYFEPGTSRVLDKQRNNLTTSEGQSYAMLRAVWMDDKPAFDESWRWTRDNLKRPNDRLFAWAFGQRPDGSYGILPDGGENTASDADVDIALALLFAYSRWQDRAYLEQALGIIDDIWRVEVVTIGGKPYLAANSKEKGLESPGVLLNPSYFAPYAYRIFAQAGSERDWNGLVDTSYEVLERSMELPLDKETSAGLPPDWVVIDRRTGELRAPSGDPALTTNYSYDALRVPFRLAIDHAWFRDERAKAALDKMGFLLREWERKGRLGASYTHDGRVAEDAESVAMYGGSAGLFLVSGGSDASKSFYDSKLLPLYDPDVQSWKRPLGYYDSNMAWFGLALYSGSLDNLFEINFR